MEELINFFNLISQSKSTFGFYDVLLVTFFAFVSAIIVSLVYKKTYKGIHYSQSFVQSILLIEIITAILMLVIGTNIVLAFGFVGALSMIRFRMSVRDPKDVSFIFFAVTCGSIFGSRYYASGLLFTVILSVIIYILYAVDYGKKCSIERIIKITLPRNFNLKAAESVLSKYTKEFYLVGKNNISQDDFEYIYILNSAKKIDFNELTNDLVNYTNSPSVSIMEDKKYSDDSIMVED